METAMPYSKSYVILGDPTPLARPRMANYRVYDSQKHEKLCMSIEMERQHDQARFFVGALSLNVFFYFDVNKLAKKKRPEALQVGYRATIPDLSNLIKFVEDCATGILYADDCLIVSIHSIKKYDEVPRTEFTLTELL